ncbi:MAG: GTP-binding protein [Candidatus Bathyarchaeia archaeon]
MRYRLNEGGGEAFYEIGVSDDGDLIGLDDRELELSLNVLEKAAKLVGAKCRLLRIGTGRVGKIAEVHIRVSREGNLPIFLEIPLLGNVDAGKSSLVGVLSTGEMDDGRGLAMRKVARYIHEIKTGRTSSISIHPIGFSEDGDVVNHSLTSPLDESQVFLKSSKIINLIDLGGHEKYLRTTLKGLMGRTPDYALLLVGANAGVIGTTKEHLGIATALKIPIIMIITKIDMVSSEKIEQVLNDVFKLLKMPGVDKIPLMIRGVDDISVAVKTIQSGRVTPVFLVSNKTGEGLNLLKLFLNLLPPRMRWEEKLDKPFMMYVEDKFNVKGVGVVVSGVVLQGSIGVDDYVQIGPFDDGSSRLVKIKSIHLHRTPVQRVFPGQNVCLALSSIEYDEVLKGMCILDKSEVLRPVRIFEAKVTILHHPTTIWRGYNAVIHIHTIRQTAELIESSREPLRTGVTSYVKFSFKYRPVHIRAGDWFVFREGRTRGIGLVTAIVG